MKHTTVLLAALAGFASTTFADSLKSREIRLDACPTAVRETILDHARNGRVEEVEFIRFGDQVLYIAEVNLGHDDELDIHVDANGRLIETREEISLTDLPPAALTAVQALGGKPDDANRHIKGETTTFHLEIDRAGQPDLNVIVSPEGRILEQSEEADD